MKYRWAALSFFLLCYLFPEIWNAFTPELREMGTPLICRRVLSLFAAGGSGLVLGLFLLRFTRDHKIAGLGALLYLSFLQVLVLAVEAETIGMFFLIAALASFLPACMRQEWDRVKVVQLMFCALCLWLPLHLAQCCEFFVRTAEFFIRTAELFLVAAAVMILFLLWERRWRDFSLAAAVLLPSLLALWCNGELLAAVNAGSFNWNALLLIPFGLMPGGLLLIVGLQGARGNWGEWLRLSHIRYLLCFLLVGIFHVLWSGLGLLYFFPLAGLGAIAVAAYFRQGGTQRFFRWIMAFWGCFWLCIAAMNLLEFSRYWLWITLCILYGAALLIAAIRYGWRDVLMIFFLGMIPLLIQMQLFAVQE